MDIIDFDPNAKKILAMSPSEKSFYLSNICISISIIFIIVFVGAWDFNIMMTLAAIHFVSTVCFVQTISTHTIDFRKWFFKGYRVELSKSNFDNKMFEYCSKTKSKIFLFYQDPEYDQKIVIFFCYKEDALQFLLKYS